MAEVLRHCRLIIWDESTMAHRGGVEALDRTLKDIRNNNKLMGGLTVLLAEDKPYRFCQEEHALTK